MEGRVANESEWGNEIAQLKEMVARLSEELETLRKEKDLIEKYYDIFDGIGILEMLTKEKEVISHYYDLFDNIGVSLGEFDLEELRKENERLKKNGNYIEE